MEEFECASYEGFQAVASMTNGCNDTFFLYGGKKKYEASWYTPEKCGMCPNVETAKFLYSTKG